MEQTEKAIEQWIAAYGYHAVAPALLVDPAGVPWAWIFLMLLAEQAKMNIWFMLAYGFGVMMLFDHLAYGLGAAGSKTLLPWMVKRWPAMDEARSAACREVSKRGAIAIIFGRYLPFIGRWTGLGAGLAGIPYWKFSLYEAIGAGLSVYGFGLAAHFIGREMVDHPWFHEIVVGSFVVGSVVGLIGLAISRLYRKPAATS